MDKNELELINKYTNRPFSEDELFTFSVTLCDNEIDRDNERFSDDALQKLSRLFVGVTGITDHDPRADNQTARIYECRTESPQGQYTGDGRQYIRLRAKAYIPRSKCSDEVIMQIESGIKKEVSVGCAVAKRICSVCNSDFSSCNHIAGHIYSGKKCCVILDEPTDAYEWSFVAVPAQKAAGVSKFYRKENKMDIEKKLLQGGEQTFSADEMKSLSDRLSELSEKAADGEAYRTRLLTDIRKLSAVALPQLKSDTLSFITSSMNADRLEELHKALSAKASEIMPAVPQLAHVKTETKYDNSYYNNI